jgi:hypothetical protein
VILTTTPNCRSNQEESSKTSLKLPHRFQPCQTTNKAIAQLLNVSLLSRKRKKAKNPSNNQFIHEREQYVTQQINNRLVPEFNIHLMCSNKQNKKCVERKGERRRENLEKLSHRLFKVKKCEI